MDIHDLRKGPRGWELTCYQIAQILEVPESLLSPLRLALERDESVRLSWDPETGVVRQVE